MTKTLDDYLSDPSLANEPQALREVHAIRLKIQDERKGLTAAEYNAIARQRAARFLAPDNFQPSETATGLPLFPSP